MSGTFSIKRATTVRDLDEIRLLFREYETFLNVDLSFQKFEDELANLPGPYDPPEGILVLANDDQGILGCGALRRFGSIDTGACEMKRLFVRPRGRGQGLGRGIAEFLITEAGRLGYGTMVLDTLDRLESAVKLYHSLGFQPTAPYYHNPLPGVLYWTLDLAQAT